MKPKRANTFAKGVCSSPSPPLGGRPADPTSLPLDDAHLDDDAMKAALDDLPT